MSGNCGVLAGWWLAFVVTGLAAAKYLVLPESPVLCLLAVMSEEKNPNNRPATDGSQENELERQFTPEELRKAERTTWILYGVMAVMILLPFVVLFLRKGGD